MSRYRLGPAWTNDFGPEPPLAVPPAPGPAGVEVTLGRVTDPRAIPVVVPAIDPAIDPATVRPLAAIHVVYAPLEAVQALGHPGEPDWFLAAGFPTASAPAPPPGAGGTVAPTLDPAIPVYGPRHVQVVLEDAEWAAR